MQEERLIPTRRSLLSRLKSWDNQDSWQEFFEIYWRLLYNVCLKAGLSDAEAQDAVQDTIICVAQQMPGFKYDPSIGSFKGWLLLITRRRVADRLRKRYRTGEVGALDANDTAVAAQIAQVPEPAGDSLEAIWNAEWEQHLASAALERVKRQVKPAQFQIFHCSVIKGWPLEKVTESLGVTKAQVYLARHRIGHLFKKEVEHLENQML